MTHTIFALDSVPAVPHHMAVNLIKQHGGKEMVGKYVGMDGIAVIEPSFILATETFNELRGAGVLPVEGQESFLIVSECNKQYAWLTYNHEERDNEYLGCLKAVSAQEAMEQDNWTHDPLHNRWFITTENSQSEAPHERDQRRLWAAIDDLLGAMCDDNWEDTQEAALRIRGLRDEMKPKWLDNETAEEGKSK